VPLSHFHAYRWLGAAAELDREEARRPALPPIDASYARAFADSEVPPLELAYWLLRPWEQIRETFEEPRPGAEWMREQMEAYAGEDVSAAQYDAALRTLEDGGSASWGRYVGGTRFLSVSVISCSPNNYRPGIPCPLTR
jgi:hypothetical protein